LIHSGRKISTIDIDGSGADDFVDGDRFKGAIALARAGRRCRGVNAGKQY
jgi:hypothetical protein